MILPTKWFLVIAIAVIIAFATVAMTAAVPHNPSAPEPPPTPVVRSIAVKEAVAPRTGFRLPPVVVKDLEEQDVDLASYRGKVLVLHLFASWCDPCKEEMPELVKLAERVKDQQCVVLGVSTESVATLRAAAAEHGLNYPILREERRALRTVLGTDTVPRTVVVDRGGRVVAHFRGYHGDLHAVEQRLRVLGIAL
jgi:peroxiredoxin